MSDREQKLTEAISKLPPELQDRMLDKAEGAAMALDLIRKTEEQKEDKP